MVALTACSPIAASGRAQAAAPARSLQIAAPRPQRAALRPAAARRRWACRATAEKEGSSSAQGTEAQPQVPAAGGDQQQAQQPSAASQLNQAETLSVEEIQQRAAALRQQKSGAADGKEGLLQGVTEEIGLIKWPGFGKATLQTLLVIAIVAGTAATLLAINGLLAELSKQLY